MVNIDSPVNAAVNPVNQPEEGITRGKKIVKDQHPDHLILVA